MNAQTEAKSILDNPQVLERAIIYARVSTDEQAESGTSIDSQLEKSLAYAAAHNLNVKAIFKEDYTGKVLDRPELNNVREMLRAGMADNLIVYKTNRLDRSEWGLNLLILLQEFKQLGVSLHYSQSGRRVDLSNPVEALMQSIEGWQAGEDHREVVTRLQEGRIAKVKQGSVMLTGQVPYGYKKIKVSGKTLLESNIVEVKVIQAIFKWFALGASLRRIAAKLDGLGVTPPSRGKPRTHPQWNTTTIKRILTNEVYIGIWRYGKTKIINGKQRRNRDVDKTLSVSVPAIIERDVFEAAQECLKSNEIIRTYNQSFEYLLSGLCTCGECGHKLIGRSRKEYADKGLKEYLYYYCPNPACKAPYWRAAAVESTVWNWIIEVFNDENKLQDGLKGYQAETGLQAKPKEDELAIVQTLIEQHTTELESALLDLRIATSPRAKARIADDIARIEGLLDGLEQRQGALQSQIEATTLTDEQLLSLRDFAEMIRADLDTISANFEAKRSFLARLNIRVTLRIENYQRRAHITGKIGDILLPVRRVSQK